jgi:hypothetical protein
LNHLHPYTVKGRKSVELEGPRVASLLFMCHGLVFSHMTRPEGRLGSVVYLVPKRKMNFILGKN